MSDQPLERITTRTENGIQIWVSGWYVVAMTREMVFAKRFETQAGREKVIRKIEEGEPVKSAMGMLTKSLALEAIRNVCLVADLGVLVVRGGKLKEPIRLEFPESETPTEIFEALRDVCDASAEIQLGKAGVNDVPLDPQLGLTILFGLLGMACVIGGAFEAAPIQGGGKWKILGEIGQWIGPIPAFLLGGLGLVAAVFFTLRWRKNLPEMRSFDCR